MVLTIYLALATWALHPFHVSVTEIEYDEKSRVWQVSQRIFWDDFEEALQAKYGEPIGLTESDNYEKALPFVQRYFQENLFLEVDGEPLSWKLLGFEKEEDAIWCYIETEKSKKAKTLNIKNLLLMEVFDNQENIVHLKYLGEKKSCRLVNRRPDYEFIF